jgi:hypothetical protein
MSEDQKRIWKEEAKQFKEDLKKCPKVCKKREVPIKLGKQAKKAPSSSDQTGDRVSDDFYRRNIGLI